MYRVCLAKWSWKTSSLHKEWFLVDSVAEIPNKWSYASEEAIISTYPILLKNKDLICKFKSIINGVKVCLS